MTIVEAFWGLLFFLCGVALWRHYRISERAYTVAKAHTQKHGVLLLDQTIILKRYRLKFSRQNLCQIERYFEFEFATVGDVRYRGSVTFLGPHIVGVHLQPFKDQIGETL